MCQALALGLAKLTGTGEVQTPGALQAVLGKENTETDGRTQGHTPSLGGVAKGFQTRDI